MSALEGSTILIADDEVSICDLLRDVLEPEGAATQFAHSGQEALAALRSAPFDLAIIDIRMPPPDGLMVLQELHASGIDIPVLIITAQDSSTTTIEAIQAGAYDYIAKPFDPGEILATVSRALNHARLAQRVHLLEQQTTHDPRDTIIGRSAPMQSVYKLIGRVAPSDATVLVTGESGTGKELVTQAIHHNSPRHSGPFIAVNCAALSETLLESELFGHEKGAFTGAVAQRKGRFEQAHKGTLFLDEIGEISANTQKKLLRVLQERNFERVGGNTAINIDVRIISATNRDLLAEVKNGAFREDLYYRLSVINIHMPPLRERKDDIPILIDHFLSKLQSGEQRPARLSTAALDVLMHYDWPGNVRQLEHTIERAIVLAQGSIISPEHLLLNDSALLQDQLLMSALDRLIAQGAGMDAILANLRQRLVTLALAQVHGDRGAAASLLQIPERDLDPDPQP
jgi:two-component system, NtrC family, response regulator AtoC